MKRLASTSLVMMITAVYVLRILISVRSQQITPEQRTQMCDPTTPKLNFVNSTELV